MAKQCPRCALQFERDEGSRLGSAMVNYAVVGTMVVVSIVGSLIATAPNPPVLQLVLLAVPLLFGVAIVFFPFSKTIWAAIELVMRGAD
jgi:hypothetical protein